MFQYFIIICNDIPISLPLVLCGVAKSTLPLSNSCNVTVDNTIIFRIVDSELIIESSYLTIIHTFLATLYNVCMQCRSHRSVDQVFREQRTAFLPLLSNRCAFGSIVFHTCIVTYYLLYLLV